LLARLGDLADGARMLGTEAARDGHAIGIQLGGQDLDDRVRSRPPNTSGSAVPAKAILSRASVMP
jgi:hypothetical protein